MNANAREFPTRKHCCCRCLLVTLLPRDVANAESKADSPNILSRHSRPQCIRGAHRCVMRVEEWTTKVKVKLKLKAAKIRVCIKELELDDKTTSAHNFSFVLNSCSGRTDASRLKAFALITDYGCFGSWVESLCHVAFMIAFICATTAYPPHKCVRQRKKITEKNSSKTRQNKNVIAQTLIPTE